MRDSIQHPDEDEWRNLLCWHLLPSTWIPSQARNDDGGVEPVPFALSVTTEFAAAHCLRGYDGDCARLHGHNWQVKLTVEADALNDIGIAIDYKRLKGELKAALADWDHYNLNDIPPFDTINPSSEHVACELYRRMQQRFADDDGICVREVEIGETCATRVRYWE